MGITDLIKKKKAMHFEVQHREGFKPVGTHEAKLGFVGGGQIGFIRSGTAGQLGPGVETYHGKTIGEKLNDLKGKVSQRKSEVLLRKTEAKAQPKKVVGFNLLSGGTRVQTKTKLSDKIRQSWEDRAKKTGGGMFGNQQSNSIFSQQSSQSGELNPIFHGTGSKQGATKASSNPGNNIFTMGSGSNPFTFTPSQAPAVKSSPVKKKVITYYK